MAEFINTIDVIGDDLLSDSIIERSITEYKDNIITSIGIGALRNCKQLTSVDLPVVTSIESMAFFFCSQLITLILRSENLCILSAINAFSNSAIGAGYIYVPRALLSDDDATKDYRRASNWANFSTQFRALEDYTVDGTITGELDESKI